MSDANTTTQAAASGGGDEEVERINLRVPNQKYEWLQNELDSFTSDTARFQYLIRPMVAWEYPTNPREVGVVRKSKISVITRRKASRTT